MKKKLLLLGIFIALMLGSFCLSANAQETQEDAAAYDGYLVKLKENAVMLMSLEEEQNIEMVGNDHSLYVVDTPQTANETFGEDNIEYMEPNYVITLFNDVSVQSEMDNWGLNAVNASFAWSRGIDAKGITIGIIDSGLIPNHEDINYENIKPGYNFMEDSTDTSDTYGHGSFITGIIAAQRDNGVGINGIADSATIVPLKCFENKNSTLNYALDAIQSAVDDYHCDIINLSWGIKSNSEFLKEKIDYAIQKGVIVIAAVGNSYSNTLYYPAAFDSVIGVGSVGQSYQVSAFSQKNESVFICAPGESVVSISKDSEDSYKAGNGTSYAAPYVTATAALLKSLNYDMTVEDLKNILINSSKDLGPDGYDTSYGYGLLNIQDALSYFWGFDGEAIITNGQIIISGSASKFEPQISVSLLIASYNDFGQMTELKSTEATTNEYGILSIDGVLTEAENIQKVKVFLLSDQTPAPVSMSWEPSFTYQ